MLRISLKTWLIDSNLLGFINLPPAPIPPPHPIVIYYPMFTFKDFLSKYPDDKACLRDIVRRKGLRCCGKLYYLKKRPVVLCSKCKKQYSPLVGTIFERSTTPLTSWFYAIYLMTSTKHGVPAAELQRQLGVTYKCAWRIGHKIREVMMPPVERFRGKVEIDETFVGGKSANRASKWYSRAKQKKQIVLGIMSRDDKQIKPIHVPNLSWTLTNFIRTQVKPFSTLFTDQLLSYKSLPKFGYRHYSINHKYRFVKGNVHTQNVENFWSHLKRGITGVYRSVSSKHLQAYANEFAYRYNHRDKDMFPLLLKNCLEKPQEELPPDLRFD